MSYERLIEIVESIKPLDNIYYQKCKDNWDGLCKPLGGLGWLEEVVSIISGIQRTDRPNIDKRAVIIMGADNGVVAEGVTQTDSSVTLQVLENMGDMNSAACVMSKLANATMIPVNIGALGDGKHEKIRNRVVRYGTDNIAKGPAMTRQDCIDAILTGIDVVRQLKEEDYKLIVIGEMGIGNTTTCSACTSVLFNQKVETVTGKGAGLSNEGLQRKIEVIKEAIKVNGPNSDDVIDVVTKVGGLDIAGMVGCYIGAACYQIPALMDGVISQLSAYVAFKLCEKVKDYAIATHCSTEPASKLILDGMNKNAPLQAGMHMGEATGGIAVLSLIDQGFNVYYNLVNWDGGRIAAYTHFEEDPS